MGRLQALADSINGAALRHTIAIVNDARSTMASRFLTLLLAAALTTPISAYGQSGGGGSGGGSAGRSKWCKLSNGSG